jgi:putative ABC transport system permease protein
MPFPRRVPLAWRNLVHDKRRFLVAVAGITFAALLMFMELGFWNALIDAAVELVRQFNGQIVVVSKASSSLAIREQFSTRHLDQARAVGGVQDVFPVYIERRASLWKDPENRGHEGAASRPIRVIAFDPAWPVLRNAEVEGKAHLLLEPDTVLIDRLSKKEYGRREEGLRAELARHSIKVVGTFRLGTDFTADGTVIMSDLTYAKLFPNRRHPQSTLRMADVGLVQLRPGADAAAVKLALEGLLPADDVQVFTKDEFIDSETRFWQRSTPIGFIFTFGLWMGFIVGLVICYQILSADVADHLSEYATLKAIGYRNRFLTLIVLQEAVWLSLLGFVPALLFAYLLYGLLGRLTGLPLFLTVGRAGLILLLTTSMCILSGVLAIRKVQTADPAEVF